MTFRFLKVILFVCLFLAVLGLHCCVGFSPVAARGDYSLVAVCGVLISVASLVCRAWALGCVGFSSCGFQALELRLNSCGTWA